MRTANLRSNKKVLIGSLAIGLLVTFVPPLTLAQSEAPAWLNVRVVQVKTDRVGEWVELQQQLAEAMRGVGGPGRIVLQEARGNPNTFHIVAPVAALGQNDDPAAPPLPGPAWENWVSRVVDCIASVQVLTVRDYPELAIPPAQGSEPNLTMLRFRQIAAGANDDYYEWLETNLVPALRDAGVEGYTIGRVYAGGDPGTWVSGSAINNWAELDQPGPFANLSEREADRIFGPGAALVRQQENIVVQYRADLSVDSD